MQRTRAALVLLASIAGPAFGQNHPAGSSGIQSPAANHSPAQAAPSTPDSRSAAALALTDEPIYDEGTAERIRQAALSYSDIEVRGGWPTIPAEAKFVVGVEGQHDALLRKRLAMSGDLEADKPEGPYDDRLSSAVKRFQLRHGLAPTGTVTPRTLAALNVTAAKRIQQLEASLERLGKLDFAFGQRYVVVNIPAAYAEAIENDNVTRRYRVIVGKTEKPSPTLTAEITAVNLNPTWTVPASITKNEIAAHMKKDRGYLNRMHMELLDVRDNPVDPGAVDWSQAHSFTVRQQSGSWNALGSVRIDMPNPYSVYMHDTNQRNLFANDYRFDSHGCSRVDNVRDLAAWLLRDLPQWNRKAIDEVIASGQRETVQLPHKVPVAWIYLTGWMTRDQTIQFRNDVYDQDAELLEATAEEAAFFNQADAELPHAEKSKAD